MGGQREESGHGGKPEKNSVLNLFILLNKYFKIVGGICIVRVYPIKQI